MECWEGLLGEGCFLNLALKDEWQRERWPPRAWPEEEEKWGRGSVRSSTHSQRGSSPQTHPSPPCTAPWPSHSDRWGWPDLWQWGSWPRTRGVSPSSLEGRRCCRGSVVLRLSQMCRWSSLSAWGIWREQPYVLAHTELPTWLFLFPLIYYCILVYYRNL